MIDIRGLREDPALVKELLGRRGVEASVVEELAAVDSAFRDAVSARDELRSRVNDTSRRVAEAYRSKETAEAERLKDESRRLGTELDRITGEAAELEQRRKGLWLVSKEAVWVSRIMWVALSVVLFVGTAVTGSGPHSGSPLAVRLPFPLRAVAELHADFVLFLIGLSLASIFLLHQGRAPEPVMKRARALLWLMAAQGFIGYTQYFTNLPALLVEFHIVGATAVWVAMIWHNLNLFERRVPVGSAPAVDEHLGAELADKGVAGQA